MSRKIKIASLWAAMLVMVSSCSKDLEDRLVGNWKLKIAWKSQPSGASELYTGYENGLFHLENNGKASYTEGTDTLTGYWKAGKHNKGIYNNSEGHWESRNMQFLLINIEDRQQIRRLEWRFDDFDQKNDGRTIRAVQYTLGYDRIYEFERR
ncbi:MAG: hypothetical protein HZA79_10630 [Sphingobacteriales bacterium]|nr:hypothetical protein [Sphingobacteriales bacterium]